MDKYLPAVQQMSDLTNAIHALIGAIVLGLTGVAGAYLYQVKVYLPRQFKQRDEERANAIEAAKLEMQNKAAAEKVDIARENLLPTLVENNQRLVESMIANSQANNAAIMARVQQDVTNNNTMAAHTKAVTSVAEKLEELADQISTQIVNIQNLEQTVTESSAESKAAAAYANRAAEAARETLAFVRNRLAIVIDETKGDTGELKAIDVTEKTDLTGGSAAA